MRWIVLALSLGAMIVSLMHGVLVMWQLVTGGGAIMVGGVPFTWMTNILLLSSAVITLIGGILAFNGRKAGGFFLATAAFICFFAHPSTRVYGVVHLIAAVLAFLVRKTPDYDDEESGGFVDEGEYDYDAEENEEEKNLFGSRALGSKRKNAQEFSYNDKRKERASRINLNREEFSLRGDDVSKINEPLRIRSSKVCPACGASVGIDHKFCYTCGSPLYGARLTSADLGLAPDAPSSQDPSSAFRGFQMVSPTDDAKPARDDSLWTKSDKYDGNYEKAPEEEDEDEIPEEPTPHRIFMKSSREDEAEDNSFMVDPDDSYQEFSNYTRRRKRRRNTLMRRILGPLVLLLAVSGAAWMLLGGLTREPPEPPPLPPIPIPDPEPIPIISPPAIWELLQMEAPARGVVTGTNVNIRQSNAATGPVVTRLSAGARGEIIEQRDGAPPHPGPWYNIRFNGRTGWIYGQFFQALDGRAATLPRGYTAELLNSFGTNRMELVEQLGAPTRQTPAAMTWTGITAELRGEDVVRLQITGAQHVLQNELAVGLTEEILYRRVGYPSDFRGGSLRYVESGDGGAERGMVLRLQNGRIQSITVGNI